MAWSPVQPLSWFFSGMKWIVHEKGHHQVVLLAMELLGYFQELDFLMASAYNRQHGFAAGNSAALAQFQE
jgi:hypothetical protein